MYGDPVMVLKFGGSVLRSEHDLPRVVQEVQRWTASRYAVVAVVSAFAGTTERLLEEARAIADTPDEVAVATLAATGEARAAALLALAVAQAGIGATVLDAACLGLRASGPLLDAEPTLVNAEMLREVLGQNRVAVVPGFVARAQDGSTALLGRGGSDLTALFLAERLRAERCRLIKDVDGLYQHDPNMGVASPPRYRTVSWDDAVALGGGIVQAKALRFARERRLPFEVAALGQEEGTVVDGGATSPFAAPAPFIAWGPHCPAEGEGEHRLQTGGSR